MSDLTDLVERAGAIAADTRLETARAGFWWGRAGAGRPPADW
jgi:hypothetical protein